jgi:hypothetical protein
MIQSYELEKEKALTLAAVDRDMDQLADVKHLPLQLLQ